MNLIGYSIARPRAVIAAVLMVTMFGALALRTIPIQLTPDVTRPVINVTTNWRGGSPAEIEREIVNRQEEAFKGLEGLASMESASEDGRARITLEFNVAMDMDKALLLVANRLDRVSGYPAEAGEPTLRTRGSEDSSIAWMAIRSGPGDERPIHTFGEFVEDVVQERLERVPGVGRVDVYGTSRRELRVEIDPFRLARARLTVSEVLGRLRAADASVSAGEVEEGKRRYVVRTDGAIESVDDVRNVLLRTVRDPASGRIARLTVGDVADVRFAYQEPRARIRNLGTPALAVSIKREIGANVIETMEGIREAVAELRAGPIRDAGLTLHQVYDETVYIDSAIDLVQQNVYVGGALAAIVLLVFLRSLRATTTVVLAIPVSIVGSFVAMAALGRSINVISLAGLAFAVGMVVDAAIVVLENIYRLREQGVPAWEAARRGASQVWGAVLVSALTTVMVFIPILVLELEIAQLFRDIAVAISVAVMLSLLVAVTVIPALGSRLLDTRGRIRRGLRLPGIDAAGRGFTRLFVGYAGLVARSRIAAALIVVLVCGATSMATLRYLPKLEYLPEGNRNLVFGMILPPPGYNLETTTAIARDVEDAVRRHWTVSRRAEGGDATPPVAAGSPASTGGRGASATAPDGSGATARSSGTAGPPGDAPLPTRAGNRGERPPPGAQPGGRSFGAGANRRPPPGIDNFFFVATPSRTFVGATSAEPERAGELIPVISGPVFREPGTFGFVTQPSLFGRTVGGGKRVDLDIKGPELETVLEVARRTMGQVLEVLPRSEGTQVRPRPGLELGAPEVRIAPDRARLADSGVSVRELGEAVDVFNDGLRIAEVTADGRRLDFVLAGPRNERTQQIADLPVVASSGAILPVRSLADVRVTAGPTEILHRERVRTVTLEIRPPPSMTLEEAMETVRARIIAPIARDGLPEGVRMGLSGTADKLTATHEAMKWQLVMALVIVYLVMAILFESFVYPALIVLSVPLATAGAVGGLAILNLYQPQALDMLTMLGFVILIGIVVNNAILLVHQALHHLRDDGLEPVEAIVAATRNRIRPIFMSTLTSVFGMLPLVLFPGAGSELYRGLGSVVVGGLALSAVLTLAIIPPLLSIAFSVLERKRTPVPAGVAVAPGTD
ncbi:MAG: efflux RND transporter permease subunit [Immundisolibacterales bacterium]|nr:efflux RND transporter permease subunit [Immundisolibacterales bacterium]